MKCRKRTAIVMAVLLAALALTGIQRAWADAAPPPNAAASDIVPGQGTQVQMGDESVTLDVRDQVVKRDDYTFTSTVALVTAHFTLRNLGSADESLDVRFPLSWPTLNAGSPAQYGTPIQKIQTYVNDAEVPNKQVSFDGQPWAVWPVRFPPGQDVKLSVVYIALPIDWGPFVDFYYILETGAGWRGPIGKGSIIFRFPYPADMEMLARGESTASAYYTSTLPPVSIDKANQFRWDFTTLDPTSKDNVRLSVLKPDIWQAILDARRKAQAQPDDAQAQLKLGQAYRDAIPIKHGWPEGSALADHFGSLAEAALKRAVELAPNSAAAHVGYANYLTDRAWSNTPEPYYTQARQQVKRALELEPGNEDAKLIAAFLDQIGSLVFTPTPTGVAQPTATATGAPLRTPTASASLPVTGSVVLKDGASVTGGTVGSMLAIDAAFKASSPAGPVTEMRTVARYGGNCVKDMSSVAWEPFASAKTFTVTVGLNFIGFYVSAQFRDANGNLSPSVCDDISVEGMPAQPTTVAASATSATPAPAVAPTAAPRGKAPGLCGSGAIVLFIVGLAAIGRRR